MVCYSMIWYRYGHRVDNLLISLILFIISILFNVLYVSKWLEYYFTDENFCLQDIHMNSLFSFLCIEYLMHGHGWSVIRFM